MAFYELEPFGDDWRQAGVIASAVRSPYAKEYEKPELFYPFKPRDIDQTPEDMEVIFRSFGAHLENVNRVNNRQPGSKDHV